MESRIIEFFLQYWHIFLLSSLIYYFIQKIWIRKSPENTGQTQTPPKLIPSASLDNVHNVKQIPFVFPEYSVKEMIQRSQDFYELHNQRRTLRFFSSRSVPIQVVENIIHAAGTAPSGAHTEPWTYVVVSNPTMKSAIREIVEREEELNYKFRMSRQWVEDLAFTETTWEKPYLTEAPYIILLFKQTYGIVEDGTKKTHYYNDISCSISAGLFLTAANNAGLVTLTSTPLNCGSALRDLTGRPVNEKLLLLLPLGYPSPNATVPDIKRKPLHEIMITI